MEINNMEAKVLSICTEAAIENEMDTDMFMDIIYNIVQRGKEEEEFLKREFEKRRAERREEIIKKCAQAASEMNMSSEDFMDEVSNIVWIQNLSPDVCLFLAARGIESVELRDEILFQLSYAWDGSLSREENIKSAFKKVIRI